MTFPRQYIEQNMTLYNTTIRMLFDTINVIYFNCRFVYPEFLPDPNYYHRDRLKEKLERRDMLRRRAVLDIPEFYPG